MLVSLLPPFPDIFSASVNRHFFLLWSISLSSFLIHIENSSEHLKKWLSIFVSLIRFLLRSLVSRYFLVLGNSFTVINWHYCSSREVIDLAFLEHSSLEITTAYRFGKHPFPRPIRLTTFVDYQARRSTTEVNLWYQQFSFLLVVLMLSPLDSSIVSVVSLFSFFIMSMAHFPVTNVIPISWLQIIIFCTSPSRWFFIDLQNSSKYPGTF